MISATAMTGVSAFVRAAFGANVLRHANQATMLDMEMIETLDCFIPQAIMTTFCDAVERSAGEANFGLILAPYLSVSDLGQWGEYVLAGDTLQDAIARAATSLGYHCSGDRITLSASGPEGRLRYVSAARGMPGYSHVAIGNAGSMLSLFRSYLSSDWTPRMIELDIPRPRISTPFEDTFGCPVTFDAASVSILFEAHVLDHPARRRPRVHPITLEDVARSRFAPADLDSFVNVVVAHIWAQVLAGAVSLDSTAQALDMSVRSVQRELNREGVDFRALTNAIRIQRAKELLEGTRASITEISTALGYSAPANFARTFRKATEVAPQEFRRLAWSAATPRHSGNR